MDPITLQSVVQQLLPNGSITDVEIIDKGHSHEAWLLRAPDKQYVLKRNARKQNASSFQNEVEAQKLALKHGLSVPKIFATMEPPNHDDGYYALHEYIPGFDADSVIDTLSLQQKQSMARALGKTVARMHGIKGKYFSEDILQKHTYNCWGELCGARLEHLIDLNKDIQQLSIDKLDQIKTQCLRLIECLPEDLQPAFTHRDLWLNNVRLDNRGFTALLDFEAAKFYDPAWDFVKLHMWVFADYPELEQPFYDGYTSIKSLERHFSTRLKLCRGLEYLSGIHYFTIYDQHQLPSFLKYMDEWLAQFCD